MKPAANDPEKRKRKESERMLRMGFPRAGENRFRATFVLGHTYSRKCAKMNMKKGSKRCQGLGLVLGLLLGGGGSGENL